MQLVELYNPKPDLDSRIKNITSLLSVIDFAIVDPVKIFNMEEEIYPKTLALLPVNGTSEGLFRKLNVEQKFLLLVRLFTTGLPEYGVPLLQWAEDYKKSKNEWNDDVQKIIAKSGSLTKSEFIQSLDLRLCDHFVKIIEYMRMEKNLEGIGNKWIRKLNAILENHDTKR